jgi:hypothetical protein
MNIKLTITALALATLPVFASAQSLSLGISATTTVQATSGAATEAQLLTACAQASIDIRDSAIGSARMAYNNSMAAALDARKEAEKKAVAIDDTDAKKDAIKVAVDAYKKDVTQAQDALTKARKDAWAQFEANTNACRDLSKDKASILGADKKSASTTGELRMQATMMKSEVKALAEENKAEVKTFREVMIDSIKAFFKIKASSDTMAN